jgi:hypothetical protein
MAGLESGAFAVAHDYIIVTLNRRDFLKQNARLDIHPGLVILIPQEPNHLGEHQVKLFERALEVFATLNDDLVNRVTEVLADGSVHVRQWSAEEHDIAHISHPGWR